MDALEKKSRDHSKVITKLLRGEGDPKDNKEAVDVAAKWATYRFNWPTVEKEPGGINNVFKQFEFTLTDLVRAKANGQAMAQMYSHQLIVHALEIIQVGKPIAAINCARVLARLPERTGNESLEDVQARLGGTNAAELADALVGLLANPNDAVKYYAFRGLHYLLALPGQNAPLLPKDKEEKSILALQEFVERKSALTAASPREEIEGYRVLRREAIRALAQTHYPALGDKARPALTLARIVARDKVTPEPRLDERLEAAIGLAGMRPELAKNYQPDFAVHLIGLFVVDFSALADAETSTKKPDNLRLRPWKIDAARLLEALEALKTEAKNDHVAKVVARITPVLTNIESGSQGKPQTLATWLTDAANQPPSKELYKGVPDSAVKPASGGEAAEK
jgi:hypothetical protein